MDNPIAALLDDALQTADDRALRDHLIADSRLPGPRMNLTAVASFARAVGDVARGDDPPVDALEAMLDGWASLSAAAAPGDRPEVILPCAAIAAYGEVGTVRPEWRADELTKLRRAARDPRWRVREIVAQALQRLLDADWARTIDDLREWADEEDPLVLRAVAAAVAEPRLLGDTKRAASATDLERRVVKRYRALSPDQRRAESARTLRQALGYTISVVVAASGDFALLEELAVSGDNDLRWIVRQNLGKSRLKQWPEALDRVAAQLG